MWKSKCRVGVDHGLRGETRQGMVQRLHPRCCMDGRRPWRALTSGERDEEGGVLPSAMGGDHQRLTQRRVASGLGARYAEEERQEGSAE